MASGLESPEISLANKDVLVEIVPNQALAAAPSQTASTASAATEATSQTVGMRSHATAFEPLAAANRSPGKRVLTNEELQLQLGQSVPLPPEELAAVTNSAAHTVNEPASGSGDLAELRCTLCGFVSYRFLATKRNHFFPLIKFSCREIITTTTDFDNSV